MDLNTWMAILLNPFSIVMWFWIGMFIYSMLSKNN